MISFFLHRSSIDECSSICFSNKLPPNTILTPQCELTFTGPVPNAWYAVAIQMEDFSDKTSTTPMSSIPIQFLIRVLSPKCSIEPVMAPLTECLEVQVGTPVRFNLTAINPCNRTVSVIRGITITTRISSLSNSQLQNSTENASLSYINVNWTPQSDQIGQQQICAIADTRSISFFAAIIIIFFSFLVNQYNPLNTVLNFLLKKKVISVGKRQRKLRVQ